MTHRQHCNFYIASCDIDGGIYLCEYRGGEAFIIEKTPLRQPMYMTCHEEKMYVILRREFENNNSGLISFDINDKRLTNPGDIISTNGTVACHLCVCGGNIYCTNYLSGSVFKTPDKLVTHLGKGVHLTRQDMPHTHYINSFDGKYLLCCDLGTDEIYTYDKDLNEVSKVSVPKGHGARHLASNGGYVFCVNELESTVSVFKYNDGLLSYMSTVSALPNNVCTESTAAAIRVKDNFVYVSNRGHDSISVFEFKSEKLTLLQTVECGGKSPRDFNIFGDLLICTNETSNNVTFFKIENGIPVKMSAELIIKSPLCVV